MTKTCDTFWGSHGCELPKGHDPEQDHPVHECSIAVWDDDGEVVVRAVCSQAQYVDDERTRTRALMQAGDWTEWTEVELELFRNDKEKVR